MKYEIERTARFKKDYKIAKKRGCDLNELKKVIRLLANGKSYRKNIATTAFREITLVTENVISDLTGCSFIRSPKISCPDAVQDGNA